MNLVYLKIYQWILEKKPSRISIFEANSSSLGLAPEANTFDKKCLREKMLLFWKKRC